MLRIGGQEIPTRTVLLALSEACLIIAGLRAAMFVRMLIWEPGWAPVTAAELGNLALIAIICELTLYYSDIYDLQATRSSISILIRLTQAFGVSCLTLALIYEFAPQLALRRGVAVIAAPLTLLLILAWRLLLNSLGIMSRRSERVIVVGTGSVGIAAVREICARPELNLHVIGFLDEDSSNVGKPLVNPGIVATIDELEELVKTEKVSRVVIALKERRGHMPVPTLLRLKFGGIAVEDAGALLERITGRIALDQHSDPSWLILTDGFRKPPFVLAVKRACDIIASAALLVLFLPVLVLVALAVMAESGLPVLFRQKRTGLGGKTFEILKVRSMRQNSEARGPSWAKEGDPRITRVGRFIRKYRLDELPQLWNVVRGDMSLVGPRPEQPYFCELLEREIPYFAHRHSVRPGITGWAQIKYGYGASIEDAKRKLELDLFYLKHISLRLDLAVLVETIKVMLWGRGSQ